MSYSYQAERRKLFTEENLPKVIKNRDRVLKLVESSGAVRMDKAWASLGDSWLCLASVDYLVELGDLVEVIQERCAGQHRIFIRAWSDEIRDPSS